MQFLWAIVALGCVLSTHGASVQPAPVRPDCQAHFQSGERVSGFYKIRPDCQGFPNPVIVYCFMSETEGGLMRLHYKTGARTCSPASTTTFTAAMLKCLGFDNPKGRDFFVSSSPTTIYTGDESWILRDTTSIGTAEEWANLLNCKTPTGTSWSDAYAGGYGSVSGTLATFGSWTTMFYGCGLYKGLGNETSFRVGGGAHHVSEFIHSSCNDYKPNILNTVTSRWSTQNSRAFWIKFTAVNDFDVRFCEQTIYKDRHFWLLPALPHSERSRDGFCVAISRADPETSGDYQISLDMVFLYSQKSHYGQGGIIFNVVDSVNYDLFIVTAGHPYPAYCYEHGFVHNGKYTRTGHGACKTAVPQKHAWFHLKVEVNSSGMSTVRLNNQVEATFKPHYTVRRLGGALTANELRVKIAFKNYRLLF